MSNRPRSEPYAKLYAAIEASSLTIYEKVVLAELLNYQGAQINPKQATLAGKIGISPRTVRRALKRLHKIGILAWKRTGRAVEFVVEKQWKEILRADSQSYQIGHGVLSASLLLSKETFKPEPSAESKTSTVVANPEPNRGGGPNGNKPKPKPPGRAERVHSGVDFWPYPPEEVAVVRKSLQELGDAVRLYPPDDDIVRRVLDAAGGAPAPRIHESLVALYRRGRFRGIRSWGLIPLALRPVMSARMASGP